ncbi:MAG TPA: peroxiredoxin family protein [Pirellulales bacterium]|nr:peroxiredoxin family protein [Pirellulales bacterium]
MRLLTILLLLFILVAPSPVVAAEAGGDAVAQPAAKPEPQKESASTTPAGHSTHGEVFNEGPRQKAYLMGGTGNVSLKITTRAPDAQKFFDQGLGQLHGFWYFEAERSFRQAAALDPDCAMAYWGMAMANRENEKRGKGFSDEAVKRKGQASPREAAWIQALADYFAPGPDGKPRNRQDRLRQYVKALERIIHEYPEEIEAKAFLAVQIWQNSSQGIPISSHEAVAALLREVHAANPMHPAHHYVIHLWDGEKPERALKSASLCGQSAPGIAHMWHMPGHTFTRLNRFADAAWQQEASARVDHAHMMRDRVLPDQIHNYAHNNDWLVENLSFAGRVRDAIELAKNLIELPRHPRYNRLGGSGSSRLGRHRLFQLLTQYELWDELIALSQTPYLELSDIDDEQVRFHRAVGAARLAKGDLTQAKTHIDALQETLAKLKAEQTKAGEEAEAKARAEKKPDDQVAKAKSEAAGRFNGRIETIESALHDLHGRWALAGGDLAGANDHFGKAKGLEKEFLSRVALLAHDNAKAEQLAREAVDGGKGRVYPLANYVEVLDRCGKPAEATEAFRKLQAFSGTIDMQAPIFERLTALAPKLGLPADWRTPNKPADDVGDRPELDSLGPFRWRPSPAPDWTLADQHGQSLSLSQFRGQPVVVIFYLGFGCLHCVEQLKTFEPMVKEYADAGIRIVAISSDDSAALERAIAARQQSGAAAPAIPLAANPDLSVFKAYRSFDDFENMPLHSTFLIDRQGMVRWQDISYEPFTDAKFLLGESKRLLAIEGAVDGREQAAARTDRF